MPLSPPSPCPSGPCAFPATRRRALRWLVGLAVGGTLGGPPATAQGVDLTSVELHRREGALVLDFAARLVLPRPVEEALQRGVPLYFVAEAQLVRTRWYWRDERIARVSRSWRLALQPLTSTWRVSFGGLNQSYASFDEALAAVSRSTGWRLAELSQLDPSRRYEVSFRYRLDTLQLPSPMQINFGGASSSWNLGAERVLPLD